MATRFELSGAGLVSYARRLGPAAAVSLSLMSSASATCSLTDQSPARVNGRHLQHEEGRSDGDQRREDRHRCGGRGEDLCVCSKHWQLNWNQLARRRVEIKCRAPELAWSATPSTRRSPGTASRGDRYIRMTQRRRPNPFTGARATNPGDWPRNGAVLKGTFGPRRRRRDVHAMPAQASRTT